MGTSIIVDILILKQWIICYIFLLTEYLAAFRSFLRTEFSEENIDFWFACEDFKSTASPEDRNWKAQEIYQEFIQPAAPREVSGTRGDYLLNVTPFTVSIVHWGEY